MDSNQAAPRRAFSTEAYGDGRRSPRRICRVRAVVDVTGGPSLPAVTVDIGRDGMAVLLPCPLPDGTACRVGFAIFSGASVQRVELNARAANGIFVRADGAWGSRSRASCRPWATCSGNSSTSASAERFAGKIVMRESGHRPCP